MAKVIMIQGTSSGVGKSILTTGLCRIFKQDGYTVAPFKAQNMSNNSHKLAGDLEMARSQAIQAYACEIEPTTDSNPVLLKLSNGSIETVVNGKPVGNMSSREYNTFKKGLWPEILEAYNRLNRQYDVIVIEGAGSPVEINFSPDDLANMGMAERVNAPVFLTGDIDRGGVFASVYGTLGLMEESRRALVKGIIINKCMGKPEQFSDVSAAMERITQLPVVGIIPYTKINIEDEDELIDGRTGPKTGKDFTGDSYESYLQAQFDSLAQVMRKHLNMEMIYDLMRTC